MKIATISQTKNGLSALLERVRHGETILVMDRDQPVARIEPVISEGTADPAGRLARLERSGLVRRGVRRASDPLLRKAPPRAREGGDVLGALLSERENGR